MYSIHKLAAIGTAAMLMEPALSKIMVDSANRQFVDESGRAVIFHGVNVVYKMDPYIPS